MTLMMHSKLYYLCPRPQKIIMTKFIKNIINIYVSTWIYYENIFYNESMILIWCHKYQYFCIDLVKLKIV
jgi:hypothetical protein